MTGPLMLIALFAVGAALGWWLKKRTAATRKRVLQIALLLALGVPAAVWVFAALTDNETLGLLAGFSLMGITAVAVPLALGVLVGRKFLP